MADDSGTEFSEDRDPLELDGRPVRGPAGAPGADMTPEELVTAGRERHRHRLAWALLGLVTASVATMFWGAFVVSEEQWPRFDHVGTLVVVPLLTLLGTAVGWYYGGRNGGDGL